MGSRKSYADVLVCDGDQKQKPGTPFSKYKRLKLCRFVTNVSTSISTE